MPTPRRAAIGPPIAATLLAVAVFASGFHEPRVVSDAIPADLAIAALIGIFAVHLAVGDANVGDVARPLLPAMIVITLGSLLASLSVGLAPWVIDEAVRNVVMVLMFFAAIDILRRDRAVALRWASVALALSVIVVAAHLVLLPPQPPRGAQFDAIRARATFPNPNLAGHFVATATVALLMLPVTRWLRAAAVIAGVAGLLAVSSFGALLQFGLGAMVLAVAALRRALPGRPRAQLAVVATSVACVLGMLFVAAGLQSGGGGGGGVGGESALSAPGLTGERADRSAEGRFVAWNEGLAVFGDDPLGIGPRSTRGLEVLSHSIELHNTWLAFLVERGVIGLIGLTLLAIALWRMAPRGGLSRALLVGFFAQSLVREPVNYRHQWLVLALALVFDWRREAGPPPVRRTHQPTA